MGTPYSAPPDNPYVGRAGRDEIFSIGWRNPWRFSFDRGTHQQCVGDVGQDFREEVNTPVVNGGNYGWRVYEGLACTNNNPTLCNPANYLFPVLEYTHTGGRCSITGGYVYRGTRGTLPLGTYVYGDYCTGEIFAWNGATQTLLLNSAMNISSFGEDEQGELYVVDLNGNVSRIVSTTPGTTATSSILPCGLQSLLTTAIPDEIAALDNGTLKAGPTGLSFSVYVSGPKRRPRSAASSAHHSD